MKKSILIIAAGLVLVACGTGTESDRAASQAEALCGEFCDACAPQNEGCFDTCYDQWTVYAGLEGEDQRECVARYLIARECQLDRAPACDSPACGDPYIDLQRCISLIGEE